MKMTSIAALALAASVFSFGCGGDSGPSNDCENMVEAYAKSWERCKVDTYANAQNTWSMSLSCGKVKSSNASQVNACISALNSLACSSPQNWTSPGPCSGALTR